MADFFPGISKNIYPVGRLDYDSEGLLLLTDDKRLTSKLLEPKMEHPRTYLVQVERTIDTAAIRKLEAGVTLNFDGKSYLTKKAKAQITEAPEWLWERVPPVRFRKEIPTSWLMLTITEGRNRQVRKMTAAVGFPTLRLIRYAIGAVTIVGTEQGQYSILSAGDLGAVFQH